MAACSYTHPSFKLGFRSQGTGRCWVEDETAEFEEDGESKVFCVFHAPRDKEPATPSAMPMVDRGDKQSNLLDKLLVEWRDTGGPVNFCLPGLRCNRIDLKNQRFQGDLNLTDANFEGEACFNGTRIKKLFLDGATFEKKADFSLAHFTEGASLRETNFFGEANFRDTQFFLQTDFTCAVFREIAWFEGAIFRGNYTIFAGSKFKKPAAFARAKFESPVEFIRAIFSDVANFVEATFHRDVGLVDTKFEKVWDLGGATFKWGRPLMGFSAKKLLMERLTPDRPISLIECKFGNLIYTKHTGEILVFNECRPLQEEGGETEEYRWVFTKTDCSKLAFVNSDLSLAHFMESDLHDTRFTSCSWVENRRPPYSCVAEHKDIFDAVSEDSAEMKSKLLLLQSLYQALKTNLENDRSFIQSGEFHYWEMRIRQKLLGLQERYWLHKFFFWVYGKFADFGESYQKLLLGLLALFPFAAVLVALFEGGWGLYKGTIQWCIPFRISCALSSWGHMWNALKVAVFGVIPSGHQRLALEKADLTAGSLVVVVIAGLLAIALATLFVMALRRQFRR